MNEEPVKKNVPPIRITTVRYLDKDAWALLSGYVFGGYRAAPRVPRGIDPELVSRFIIEAVQLNSPADAFRKTVDVLRFYETPDCLPHLAGMLSGNEKSPQDLTRSACVVQAMAELGRQEQNQAAVSYFNDHLCTHAAVFQAAEILLETFVVLSPMASPDRLCAAIEKEVKQRKIYENRDEQGMREYLDALAVQRLKVPDALFRAKEKKSLLALDEKARLAELFKVYMGQSNISDGMMMTWAGRMIRKMAMTGDPEPVYEMFKQNMLKADPEKLGKDPLTDTLVTRCAQAVLYLQGKLTKHQRDLYDRAALGAANFLWDDLSI